MHSRTRPLVIGVGNAMRQDDGAGPVLVKRLMHSWGDGCEFAVRSGEGGLLMLLWAGRGTVIVVDAVSSGAAPGTIHRIDAHQQPVPTKFFNYSTHAFSLAEAVELSRVLGTLPDRLIIYGVEGERFDAGDSLSGSVGSALDKVASLIRAELARATSEAAA